jgi:hypothetical protein
MLGCRRSVTQCSMISTGLGRVLVQRDSKKYLGVETAKASRRGRCVFVERLGVTCVLTLPKLLYLNFCPDSLTS